MGRSEAELRFRELYESHHRAIVAYFLRRVSVDAAYDAAEDVFLVAWRRLDQVPRGARALPWLYGVAHRVLANHRRRVARATRLTERIAANPPAPPPGPAVEAVTRVESAAMLAALATLLDADQEVLQLTYWEELPHAEIGRILGCSTGAVHVRRYRAVRRLENALRRSGHERTEGPAFTSYRRQEG